LEFYGIIGGACQLIKSYLEERFQIVETVSNVFHNTTTFDWGKTSHGVPQESILGP